MKEARETFDLIERYLQGALGEEEKAIVESKINSDPSFAEEVASRKLINSVIVGANQDMLRERMKKDLAQLDKGSNNAKWFTGGALILLAVVTASYFYFSDNKNQDTSSPENKKTEDASKAPQQEINNGNSNKTEEIKNTPLISSKEKTNASKDTVDNTLNSTPVITQDKPKSSAANEVFKQEEQQPTLPVEHPKQTAECKITFHATAHPTCKGEHKGSIEIDHESITGGAAPYHFTLGHSSESSTGTFLGLGEGKHIVTIQDKTGCSASKEVLVSEKHCTVKKSFSINPDYGDTWKIPYAEGESGTFTILNRAGTVIFKGQFGNSGLSEWNGTDNNGAVAEVGLYVYILEYSNGKTENGQITIVR